MRDEQLLLDRARQGDFPARDELVMASYPWAVRRVSEDEAQEALLIALRKLADFRGDSSVGTWIYGICDFVVLGRQRRERRRIRAIGGDANPFAEVPCRLPTPPEVLIRKERAGRIACEIARLPREQAEAVKLWMTGLTHREIAAGMGVAPGRASRRLYQAFEALRGQLLDVL